MKYTRRIDLALLHPPSVYDFRNRLIIPSPIANLIPSGHLFEMYPIGFSFLGEYLERRGFKTRVYNLAARMLEKPGFDVERFIGRVEPAAFGIGLHWLPHCHGAVEIARLCKRLHPRVPVIMGGYSASIFHRELLEYPEIDFVVRGDSAEEPLARLLEALKDGGSPADIPNLSYRDGAGGEIVVNPLEYVPDDLDHIGDGYSYMIRAAVRYLDWRGVRAFKGWWSYPMTAVLTCKGCKNNCTFCGGSAWSMDRCFARRGIATRSPESVARDVEVISSVTGAPIFIIGDLRQPGDEYAWEVLERLKYIRPANCTVLELFEPAPREFFERAAGALPNVAFEISPESHDEEIRRAAGKKYDNKQLEENLEWATEYRCRKFDVFFMIGLEGQTPDSVMDTVSYCSYLLDRFGNDVNPLIGPLAPFLDPGSIDHARAEKHGYTLFLHTLEDHRGAILQPHWRDLLGYETRWMGRQDIVDATYRALLELNRIKAEHGRITEEHAGTVESFLRDNMSLLERYDRAVTIEDPTKKEQEMSLIKTLADDQLARSDVINKEIEWPITGGRFNYTAIARTALKRRRAA